MFAVELTSRLMRDLFWWLAELQKQGQNWGTDETQQADHDGNRWWATTVICLKLFSRSTKTALVVALFSTVHTFWPTEEQ